VKKEGPQECLLVVQGHRLMAPKGMLEPFKKCQQKIEVHRHLGKFMSSDGTSVKQRQAQKRYPSITGIRLIATTLKACFLDPWDFSFQLIFSSIGRILAKSDFPRMRGLEKLSFRAFSP
jgi:hypothetical protein